MTPSGDEGFLFASANQWDEGGRGEMIRDQSRVFPVSGWFNAISPTSFEFDIERYFSTRAQMDGQNLFSGIQPGSLH
ncbi:MAG TPA: hypothetical protein DCR17_08685, partial [Verrucomicrobiales bacterium]|nr:hypothetical protein [Verrucomicrobiales bacterium]